MEFLLIKEDDKWIIDNDVLFDRQFVDIMTCNNAQICEEMFGLTDPSDSKVTSGDEDNASIKEIRIGEKIETQNYEFDLKNVELSYDIMPDIKSSLYQHYAADAGKVYIFVDADIKNTGKQNLPCDSIYTVEADYNDGYKYTGFAIADDSDSGFTYANIVDITPLETRGVPTLVECPEEIETSLNPLFLIITMKDGSKYKYTIR